MKKEAKVSHVGLDCHRKFTRATARDAANRILFRQRLEHADRAQLRRQMTLWPAGTPVILEGSFGWGWMADELVGAGHQPHLSNSRKVDAWRKARGLAKNNKLDADLTSELWKEQDPRWWEVWLAPVEVRDQRELLRHRMGLVQVQSAIKHRIHALLHRHGILHQWSDLFCKGGMDFLREMAEAEAPLRASARLVLQESLKLLTEVRQAIAAVTRSWHHWRRDDAQARRWRSLPGIGAVLAHTIAAEVGDIGRFPGGRHLVSYSLLAPMADDSGDEEVQSLAPRHVGHAGRRVLKWAFVEAAHGAVRKDAGLRDFWERYTEGGKRNKGRGYIAVARQLAMIGTACVRNDRDYTPQRPPRPGSEPARCERGEKNMCSSGNGPAPGPYGRRLH
jgi:transposase